MIIINNRMSVCSTLFSSLCNILNGSLCKYSEGPICVSERKGKARHYWGNWKHYWCLWCFRGHFSGAGMKNDSIQEQLGPGHVTVADWKDLSSPNTRLLCIICKLEICTKCIFPGWSCFLNGIRSFPLFPMGGGLIHLKYSNTNFIETIQF